MVNENKRVHKFDDKVLFGKCLVIGDIILDKYMTGVVTRISPEAPIPVVRVTGQKYVLGGAANVAGNICGFHISPYLCGSIGNDEAGNKVQEIIKKMRIKFIGIRSNSKCTTIKTRITSDNQQIVRVDEEDCDNLVEREQKKLLENVEEVIEKVKVVIISDYGKGVCTEWLCKSVIQKCQKHNKIVIVDPKSPDWRKYANATLITPNFKEFADAIGKNIQNTRENIEREASEIIQKYEIDNLLVTRSQYGMLLINNKSFSFNTVAHEVYDVSGAGDTVVATIAALLSKNEVLIKSIECANIAAGIAVSKSGTYIIKEEEIYKSEIGFNKEISKKIVSDIELDKILNKWRNDGVKIVFTNGCFDIIHAGHISYLNEAKKLGEKLIVGLNSDESIKRLKGASRPINKQTDRAILLAAFACVDLVVFFDRDTPLELIRTIKPDLLVKGGDYIASEVIGREFAKDVKILPFIEGYSTTNIIKTIHDKD